LNPNPNVSPEKPLNGEKGFFVRKKKRNTLGFEEKEKNFGLGFWVKYFS
jgi:hypothetical protein